MPIRLFAPRYWPTWASLGLLRLLALLPFPALLALGRGVGALLLHLPIGFVCTARRNLELCFPYLDAPARKRLLEQHFSSLGMALMEIPLARSSRRPGWRAWCASKAPSTCTPRSRPATEPYSSAPTSPPWK